MRTKMEPGTFSHQTGKNLFEQRFIIPNFINVQEGHELKLLWTGIVF